MESILWKGFSSRPAAASLDLAQLCILRTPWNEVLGRQVKLTLETQVKSMVPPLTLDSYYLTIPQNGYVLSTPDFMVILMRMPQNESRCHDGSQCFDSKDSNTCYCLTRNNVGKPLSTHVFQTGKYWQRLKKNISGIVIEHNQLGPCCSLWLIAKHAAASTHQYSSTTRFKTQIQQNAACHRNKDQQ